MSASDTWIYYQFAVWTGTWAIAVFAWRATKLLRKILGQLRMIAYYSEQASKKLEVTNEALNWKTDNAYTESLG